LQKIDGEKKKVSFSLTLISSYVMGFVCGGRIAEQKREVYICVLLDKIYSFSFFS
jgi:hypothetical protein